jgi:hypothetical protein
MVKGITILEYERDQKKRDIEILANSRIDVICNKMLPEPVLGCVKDET